MTANVFVTGPIPHVASDPTTVAEHVVVTGRWGPDDVLDAPEPKVVILDGDDEPVWWLSPEQAAAVATRIIALLSEIRTAKPLVRPVAVDRHLRALDDNN